MTRLQPVRAYWRRLPDKINTKPHLEMFEAYKRDQAMAELSREIAAEIDRDPELGRQWGAR